MTDDGATTLTGTTRQAPPPAPPAPPTTDQPDPAPEGDATARPVIGLLSGANLGLLGERDPAVYGTATLDMVVSMARDEALSLGFDLVHRQSDAEADLVAAIHELRRTAAAIVINPGAFTHYAWSIHDALDIFEGPVVELHLSNPTRREAWRHTSVVTPVADALIAGLGPDGYPMAVQAAARLLTRSLGTLRPELGLSREQLERIRDEISRNRPTG